jgi:hypothetical protein
MPDFRYRQTTAGPDHAVPLFSARIRRARDLIMQSRFLAPEYGARSKYLLTVHVKLRINLGVTTIRRFRARTAHTAFADIRFKATSLKALAAQIKIKGKPDRLTVSDNVVTGLRAVVRATTGAVTFHVDYTIGDRRPYLLLGTLDDLSIEDARGLALTVKALAAKGVDPAEGLHTRLIRELREQGEKWRP